LESDKVFLSLFVRLGVSLLEFCLTSFAIQIDEMRTCLRITRELAKCFLQRSMESERFTQEKYVE